MREFEKIELEGAILHQVDPGASGLQMSGKELPLDGSTNFVAFLAAHVRNGLRDSQTRAAKWSSLSSDGVSAICQALLDGDLGLVTASQRLAVRLHAAIGNDQRVARGTLTVAVCHGARPNGLEAERFVALVKLDPSGVFRPEWRIDRDGIRYLVVNEVADVLPTLRERLQKCAFVRTFRVQDRYHLLVLDRQVAYFSAKFFMEDFLGAQLAFEDRDLTKGLYRAMRTARNNLARASLPVEQLVKLDDAIRSIFARTAVDLGEWLPTLPEVERDAIEEEVRRSELDWAFDLDPKVLGDKIRYRGDHGLKVEVDQGYEDMVNFSKVGAGKARHYRVIIETSHWDLG
jgi:37-kD nucleoid-associated bacterial protein